MWLIRGWKPALALGILALIVVAGLRRPGRAVI
jgi:hypothetical protein